ncbi:MAG: LPS biosynthesis protein WbpP [Opitutae bacterium]|nr:LPS biosynthesis protein WbpP [Opitutae bacterium]|tara:strand:- start:2740 stop:3741 length:1002 start_codon:yes stop_codon:yes gene_type:complete
MTDVLTNARILVTGGAGFIGSNLCDALLAEGSEVVCLDNFLTGKRENIAHLLANPNFTLVEGDIRDLEVCRTAIRGCTHVCHQAALGSVPRSIEDPKSTNDINISGSLNVLMSAHEEGIKRFVFASSSSVYGDEATMPKVEDKTGFPLSPYAVTKMVNESYTRVYHQIHGMETIGLRYFNVFGRRQDPEGQYAAVIPKFVELMLQSKSPIVFGDGEQTRDFTYVDNVVQMNIHALSTSNEEAFGQIFNAACGSRISINELFSSIRNLLSNYDPSIAQIDATYIGERPGDIRHSLADISKAIRHLGYQPTHDCQLGLEEAMEWYWNELRGIVVE